MDQLAQIIARFNELEYKELYNSLTQNKADKSASLLRMFREGKPTVEKFMEQFEISAAAFYVLKSRLFQRVETFLLSKLGGQNAEISHKVYHAHDFVRNNPREIATATLYRLEKEIREVDDPHSLIKVLELLRTLQVREHEEYIRLNKHYQEAVAMALAVDKAIDTWARFFSAFEEYRLSNRFRELQEMMKLLEKVENLSAMYDSRRIALLKAEMALTAFLFLPVPNEVRSWLGTPEDHFQKALSVLERHPGEPYYRMHHPVMNFLSICYYRSTANHEKFNFFFDLLIYKLDEYITNSMINVDTSSLMNLVIEEYQNRNQLGVLIRDFEEHLSRLKPDSGRFGTLYGYVIFSALLFMYAGKYREMARVLHNFRNEFSLRKYPRADMESKLLLALAYVLNDEKELSQQLILSAQRQLKKNEEGDEMIEGRVFVKLLQNAIAFRSGKKVASFLRSLDQFEKMRKGQDCTILKTVLLNRQMFSGKMEPA